jgi:gliding motility-associated-like protein
MRSFSLFIFLLLALNPFNSSAQDCAVTPSVAGTVKGDTTICSGTNSVLMSLTGSVGTIQWQQSADNINFANIVDSIANTLTVANLIDTQYYRAIVTNGACPAEQSGVVSVLVNAIPIAGSISGGTTVCVDGNSTLLAISGQFGNIQWQSSPDNNTFTSIPDSGAVTLTVDNLTVKQYYRALLANGVCSVIATNVDSIMVDLPSLAGQLTGGARVCADGNFTQLQLNGQRGSIQWQSSLDNANFGNITDSVSPSLGVENLQDTMFYRVVVKNGVCSALFSNVDTIRVDASTLAGQLTGGARVCADANVTQMQLTGHRGSIQWQSSLDNSNFITIIDSVSPSLGVENLQDTMYYRVVIQNGVCAAATSNVDSIMVDKSSLAGQLTGGARVCADGNVTQLQLTGNRGSIQWQSSVDNANFNNIIDSVSPSLRVENLQDTMYYRVVIQNGVCGVVTSNVETIRVDSSSVAGLLTGGARVCSDANVTQMQLTGHRGSIQWQSSLDNTNFTNITDSVSPSLRVENLQDTLYFRVLVQNGVCAAATSNVDTVRVDASTLAGQLTGGARVCADANLSKLQLTGHRGSIQWQSSLDNVNFSLITDSVAPSLRVENLQDTMYYRVVVQNGICTALTSNVDTIRVDQVTLPGLLSGADTVCTEVNNTVLKVNGSRGDILWQSSTDGIGFTDLVGLTDSTYAASNLTISTVYKAVLKNGVCAATETAPIQIVVTPKSLPGEIVGAKDVCYGTNSTNLSLAGNRGFIQWQSSTDNAVFTDLAGHTSSTFAVSDLTAGIFYRVVVKNGICADTISAAVSIAVNPLPEAPTAMDAARCLAGSAQLNAIPGSGIITDWYAAAAGGSVLANGNGTNSYTTPSIITSTTYFAQARNLQTGCLSLIRTPVLARVDSLSVTGIITGAGEVCSGTNSTVLNLGGYRGVIQWQFSTDNNAFTDITGATANVYNALNLTNTTYYRAALKNGVCPTANTGSVRMLVSQPSASGTITGMNAVCAEKNAIVLRVNGTTGDIQWQSSINRTTFTDLISETSDSLKLVNLTNTTYYRVVVKNGSCLSNVSPFVTQTVNPLPLPPVTEDGFRCGTGQVILRAFPPTGAGMVADWFADSIPGSGPALRLASNIFVTPDVVGTKFYYAESRSRITGCISSTRTAVMADIIPFAKTGIIAGDTIVCAGNNQVGLKLTGQEGRIQWQLSMDNINFEDIPGAKTDSLTLVNLVSAHYYRVLLNVDNGCNPSITDTFKVDAPLPTLAGQINGAQPVCAGADSLQLQLTGFNGLIQWQSSADSLNFADVNLASDSAIWVDRIKSTTFYRVRVQSGICTPDTSTAVKIFVNPLPLAPTAKDVVNCSIGPVELNSLPPEGGITDWYILPVGGDTANRGFGANQYTTDTLDATVQYYAETRDLQTGCLSLNRTKVNILFDPAPLPVITGNPGLCNGDSLMLKVNQTYGLQWYLDDVLLNGMTSSAHMIQKAGNYKVVFTNTSGCSNTSAIMSVLAYPDIFGKLIKPASNDICNGYPLQLAATGSFRYQWYRDGKQVVDSVRSTYDAKIAGTYRVAYITDKGCTVMDPDSIQLRLIKAPDAKYTVGTSTCIDIPVEFISKSLIAESGMVKYDWSFGNGKQDTGLVIKHIYTKPGLYMTQLVVTPKSCNMLADTALLYVKIESPLPAIRYPAVNAILNRSLALQAREFGERYQWLPGTGLSNPLVKNPEARLTQQQDYRIAITTTAGCTTVDSLLVRVFRENDIMVPEGFTPNADGQNDKLYPFLIGIRQMNLFRVFDRWGNVVYDNKQASSSNGWEGGFRGMPMPAGPYVWMAEGIDIDDKVIRRTGTVILVR